MNGNNGHSPLLEAALQLAEPGCAVLPLHYPVNGNAPVENQIVTDQESNPGLDGTEQLQILSK